VKFKETYNATLQNIKVTPTFKTSKAFENKTSKSADVMVWLGKVGYQTRRNYLRALCCFMESVNIREPALLLDLKSHENSKKRFFPAERLIETWQGKAHQAHVSAAAEKKTLDAVRSFFKYNRVPLLQIKCSYRPKPKQEVTDEELRSFRESLGPLNTILFDFLTSVPLRDGQFQTCPNCHRPFYPRWQNVESYPMIEPYSQFTIAPEKGHENDLFPEGLKQVCFLTDTAAKGLNTLRTIKEKQLGRRLQPSEYIFTHSRNMPGCQKHVTPIGKINVQTIFWRAACNTGIHVYPHLLRAWVNTRLSTCGIDKQLRDIYLGHTSIQNSEEGYIMQMRQKWRESLKKAHAIESLDLVKGIINPAELQDKLVRIDEQAREIQRLRNEIEASKLTKEELAMLHLMAEKMRQGKIQL
jgi:site-specific recombinase XerD